MEYGGEVDRHQPVPVGGICIDCGGGNSDSCYVDQQVRLAIVLERLFEERGQSIEVAKVTLHQMGFRPVAGRRAPSPLQAFPVYVQKDERVALPGQAQRSRTPDAGGRPGYERCSAAAMDKWLAHCAWPSNPHRASQTSP